MGNKRKLEIVFHVGPHKTATSSFQSFLSINASKLIAKGTLVPKWGTEGHHQLPWAIMGFNANLIGALNIPARYLVKLMLIQAKAFSAHRIVLSSEDFSLLSISQWMKIRKTISEENKHFKITFKCVYTVRAKEQLRESMYWELVKHGYSKPRLEAESEIKRHIQKGRQRLRLIPMFNKVRVNYQEQNHEALLAETIVKDVNLMLLDMSPIHLNKTITNPSLIEETRRANESFELDSMKKLFHWPPIFTKETWSKLQETHRQISINQAEMR